MERVVRHFDPVVAAFAGAIAVAVLVIQEGPVLALICAASVLVVGVIAEPVARRIVPDKPPEPPAPPVPAPAYWYHPLTKRQSEIAELLADPAGLSNKEIGKRLFITDRGVEGMVQNIFNSLSKHTGREFHSRTQVALWVNERKAAHPPAAPEPPTRRTVQR
jgi:DNA-binding NarL/FixJ family response regulator